MEAEKHSQNGQPPKEDAAAPSQPDAQVEGQPVAAESDSPTPAEASELESDAGAVAMPAEEPRRRHHIAPALIALERVDEDATYKLRDEGEVHLLATDIARVGQLFPVEVRLKPPDRFQIICGFRRVKALKFLHREKVLARLHTDLSDEDALLMALAAAIHQTPASAEELSAMKDRLDREGRLTALLRDMLDKALNPDDELEPENLATSSEEEIDADELATVTAAKLGEINQDLALLADVFASLDSERKLELLKQLRYSADLVAYLEGLST